MEFKHSRERMNVQNAKTKFLMKYDDIYENFDDLP